MGRWAYLDTDEERLPEGMRRVGYDARTQTYTYRDTTTTGGTAWEGVPGARYGRMQRCSTEPRQARVRFESDDDDDDDDDDEEEEDEDEQGGTRRRKRVSLFLDQKVRQFRRWSSVVHVSKKPATVAKDKAASGGGSSSSSGGTISRKAASISSSASHAAEEEEEEGGRSISARSAIAAEKGKGTVNITSGNLHDKPLPPLPAPASSAPRSRPRRRRRRRRRASTMSTIARGVLQMFSAESEYKARRG